MLGSFIHFFSTVVFVVCIGFDFCTRRRQWLESRRIEITRRSSICIAVGWRSWKQPKQNQNHFSLVSLISSCVAMWRCVVPRRSRWIVDSQTGVCRGRGTASSRGGSSGGGECAVPWRCWCWRLCCRLMRLNVSNKRPRVMKLRCVHVPRTILPQVCVWDF